MKVAGWRSRGVVQIRIGGGDCPALELANDGGSPVVFRHNEICTYVPITISRCFSEGHSICGLVRVTHRSRSLPGHLAGPLMPADYSPKMIDTKPPIH